jgi:hypothetical protein
LDKRHKSLVQRTVTVSKNPVWEKDPKAHIPYLSWAPFWDVGQDAPWTCRKWSRDLRKARPKCIGRSASVITDFCFVGKGVEKLRIGVGRKSAQEKKQSRQISRAIQSFAQVHSRGVSAIRPFSVESVDSMNSVVLSSGTTRLLPIFTHFYPFFTTSFHGFEPIKSGK